MSGDLLNESSDTESTADVTNASDDDLLALMVGKDNPDAARAAWATFYLRHVEFVYGVCLPAYGWRLGEQEVEDLVAETFRRVFLKGAATYQSEKIDDSGSRLRRVQGWLTKIAGRLACDRLRVRRRQPGIQIEPEEWQKVTENAHTDPPQKADDVPGVIEATLNEREQDVILTWLQWYDPCTQHQKLPDHVLADLATRLNTTQDNIRQIRSRAMKKLKLALGSVVAPTSNEG